MNRREFLQILASGVILATLQPKFVWSSFRQRVRLIYQAEIPLKENLRLWIPVPMDTSYQKLIDLNVTGNYDKYLLTKDVIYHAPILYLEFKEGNPKKMVKVTFIVELWDRRVDLNTLQPTNANISKEIEIFLKPTKHIPTDGIVKEYAQKITKGARTDLEKARMIYDWVVEHSYRDPKVIGCGVGDVKKMLETGNFGGKCTDINSLFVALARAVGLPAREIFGLRVLPSTISSGISGVLKDATKAQHCRAEFWLNGEWVPVDPADVRKLILEEGLTLQSDRVKKIREFMFGGWDRHWVAFNYSRDFRLEPPMTHTNEINEFMYPIMEVNGEPFDKFTLTFTYSKYLVSLG